jgi:hypothetical protein
LNTHREDDTVRTVLHDRMEGIHNRILAKK